MENTNTQKLSGEVKVTRGRSFPVLFLSGAVDVMIQASKFGKQWSKESFASYGTKKGKSSVISGAFRNRLASLNEYGLIKYEKDLIVRTELADRIVNPINQDERNQALKEAFLKPTIFKSIIDEVKHGEELERDKIIRKAITDYKISRNSKDRFIASFVESGKYAGLIKTLENGNVIIDDTVTPSNPLIVKVSEEPQKPQLNPIDNIAVGFDLLDSSGIKLGSKKQGKGWDLNLLIRFNLNADADLFKEITDLVLKAEMLSKRFEDLELKEKEGPHEQSSDNKS